jgi:hypothetical protein
LGPGSPKSRTRDFSGRDDSDGWGAMIAMSWSAEYMDRQVVLFLMNPITDAVVAIAGAIFLSAKKDSANWKSFFIGLFLTVLWLGIVAVHDLQLGAGGSPRGMEFMLIGIPPVVFYWVAYFLARATAFTSKRLHRGNQS